jgi:hypothetical protein
VGRRGNGLSSSAVVFETRLDILQEPLEGRTSLDSYKKLALKHTIQSVRIGARDPVLIFLFLLFRFGNARACGSPDFAGRLPPPLVTLDPCAQ